MNHSHQTNHQAGRVLRTLEVLSFLGATLCLLLEKNFSAAFLIAAALVLNAYASFRLRQDELEDPTQRFWFGLLGKTLVNVIFLILFLRIVWRYDKEFPTVLLVGLVFLTLRNLFYLTFSISLLREDKPLPLQSLWAKITTAVLNVTMILYALRIEQFTLRLWKVEKDVENLSQLAMVFSILFMAATTVGYLYLYYRDPDHRKPISLATQLTMSRIILSPIFMWVFFYDSNLNYRDNALVFKWTALLMVIFFAVSDGLDGHLARKFGQVSKLGKYLDPFSDKISNMIVFLCFLASGYASVWMIALIYFREATVETLRTLGASEGMVIDARRSGKWKTGIQVGVVISILTGAVADTLILKYFPEATWWSSVWDPTPYYLMVGVTLVTLLSGVDYIVANLSIIKKYV